MNDSQNELEMQYRRLLAKRRAAEIDYERAKKAVYEFEAIVTAEFLEKVNPYALYLEEDR